MSKEKLSFKQFWELSEIYTAPLNLFIILLGVSAAKFIQQLSLSKDLLIFIGIILCFHLSVNIFNHWMDYQHASDLHFKEKTNIIGREHLSISVVKRYFYTFMILAALFGLYLVSQTTIIIGILGMLGFYIGLFYSYGKYPINSLLLAETITSIASGFFITFIAFYLAIPHREVVNTRIILSLFFISLPLVLSMFNNLLANNTCDLEEDINNGRKTLVYYIGKKHAVTLLLTLTIASYLWIGILVYLKLAPIVTLGLLILLPITLKELKKYTQYQDKKETFPVVLKTMSVMMVLYPIIYALGGFF
ncbi:MAG: prenyltransferase [Vagococcus sp.]|uniref:prenyltransferase n=1 Tax=Vagococcus sp. TaxID=1933889 RepID=UPI002FCBA5EB